MNLPYLRWGRLVWRVVLPLACSAVGQAQHGAYEPNIQPASDEAANSMGGVVVPQGFSLNLFASEPLLANPVAFAIDAQMHFFVAETFRLNAGVTDMREHMNWLEDELAARTVADRVAFTKRHEGERFAERYLVEQERLRRIVDSNGDGVADQSQVFADGFNDPAAGVAAGVLPIGDDLYFACIPDMWRLTDQDGDGCCDERELQHTGWGVHIALSGHDMHGLVRGPDGRLYWSIGDRGFHVEHEGKTWAHHHAGAVLRSELDGTGLEVFATGLRNPQDLVFDDRGSLFTGDNNSDGGDRARWVYVIQGGETGWRQAYQFHNTPTLRGPWNQEGLWKPQHEVQPAYIVPPIANFADGPSGIAYYPGLIWGPEYDGSFFLCDFRGDASFSGIHRFQVQERGAGFELVGAERFLWNCLPTDVQIGVDGVLYYSDWVHGWDRTGKGRIFGLHPEGDEYSEVRASVQAILAAGMGSVSTNQLARWLGHGHQGVRLESQWELARRAMADMEIGSLPGKHPASNEADEALSALLAVARNEQLTSMARLHGVWGAGQVLRWGAKPGGSPSAIAGADRVWAHLACLHADRDPEVCAQWFKVLGDAARPQALTSAIMALQHGAARVRFFAAQCLAELGRARGPQPRVAAALVELLAEENDRDPWMRSAAVRALAGHANSKQLVSLAGDERVAVRRGVLLAQRLCSDSRIAGFLNDDEESLVAEAARAIYDVPIPSALPALAHRLQSLDSAETGLVWRCLAAHWRLHGESNAQALGEWIVACEDEALAVHALSLLKDWQAPTSIDPVMGEWRPVEHDGDALLVSLLVELGQQGLEQEFWGPKRWLAWLKLSQELDQGNNGVVAELALSSSRPRGVQQAALQLALDGKHPRLDELLFVCVQAPERGVRIVAMRALMDQNPPEALHLLVGEFVAARAQGQIQEARQALALLVDLNEPGVDGYLIEWIEELAADGGVDPLALELGRAAVERSSPALDLSIDRLRQARTQTDLELAEYVYALQGGDPSAGRAVFFEKAETQCLRCHAMGTEGGSEVGPDLSSVGTRLKTVDILRSIMFPNAQIAEGFENWVVLLDDDSSVVGRVVEEDRDWLTIETPQKEVLDLDLETVVARKRGDSSMPADVAKDLSPLELRDLVAFLNSCRADDSD